MNSLSINLLKEREELPLKLFTPVDWAYQVLEDPIALLQDHAHLERKAANNALSLLQRWPEGEAPEKWVRELTAISRDEVQHLAIVQKILEKRGSSMQKGHRNDYAAALRELVRKGDSDEETVDRLLVSAIIELRSCERFALLAHASEDQELAGLYSGLWRSEKGHYEVFIQLANKYFLRTNPIERFQEMLQHEAQIVRGKSGACSLHSWLESA